MSAEADYLRLHAGRRAARRNRMFRHRRLPRFPVAPHVTKSPRDRHPQIRQVRAQRGNPHIFTDLESRNLY
jgi:hypothetical protein